MKREDLTALGVTDAAIQDKIMALNGADIEKHKGTANTLTTERDGLRTQLTEANAKLAGYDPEWKAKAEAADKAANEKVAGMQYQVAAKAAIADMKFTSESAKKAFTTDLIARKLPLQDDKLLGLDDFVKSYKQTDPGAFAGEGKPPVFSGPTPGAAPGTATDKDKANAALRELFGHGTPQ